MVNDKLIEAIRNNIAYARIAGGYPYEGGKRRRYRHDTKIIGPILVKRDQHIRGLDGYIYVIREFTNGTKEIMPWRYGSY